MKRIWSKTTDRSGAKDWRKPWQGEKKSRNVDRSCRHGGNCAYCQENREFRATRQLESTEDQIMESALTGLTVGRLKRLLENLTDDVPVVIGSFDHALEQVSRAYVETAGFDSLTGDLWESPLDDDPTLRVLRIDL